MQLKQCSFKEALAIVNTDFNLGPNHINKNRDIKDQKHFSIKQRQHWQEYELAYWQQYKITPEILECFCVKALESYTTSNKKGRQYTIKSTINNPLFAYEVNKDQCYKIYQPYNLNKKYKFSWLGNKPTNYQFGYKQLPETGETIYLTGGEKDVLTLTAQGYNALALNSETSIPSPELIAELQKRFQKITVLYDIDETGMRQSEKICKKYGLNRIVLKDRLEKSRGKDISDLIQLGLPFSITSGNSESFQKEQEVVAGSNLEKLLATQKIIQANKAKVISFSSPILKQNNQAIFYPNTINVLQGKAGIHKSRLAETICSALLKKISCSNQLLDLKGDIFRQVTVCYVDTERNLSEQLPYALQQIQLKAGYAIEEDPSLFAYISLLEISRKERFKTLTDYLKYIREKYDNHIFIVLDVVTDCIKDFNRPEDSMELIDMMNAAINKYNVTFLCIIHENPGSIDKARGHLGTEIMNKSTTTIQIGFEKGKNGELTDLIGVKFLKCRNNKKYESFYIQYDPDIKELVFANEMLVSEVMKSRKQKADPEELAENIQMYLNEPMASGELVEKLTDDFNCSDRVIRDRIKEFIEDQYQFKDHKGQICYLKKSKEGREIVYSLCLLKDKSAQK